MSSEPVLLLAGGRLVYELDRQVRELGEATPERLVVTCSEIRAGGPPAWERRMTDSLFLRTEGATIDGAGVREAILHAIHVLGVSHVVIVGHSRCSHLDEPVRTPPRLRLVGEQASAEPDEKPESDVIDRIFAGVRERKSSLERSRASIRYATHALAGDPEIAAAGVAVSGLVEVLETGVLMIYAPEEDRFEALL